MYSFTLNYFNTKLFLFVFEFIIFPNIVYKKTVVMYLCLLRKVKNNKSLDFINILFTFYTFILKITVKK